MPSSDAKALLLWADNWNRFLILTLALCPACADRAQVRARQLPVHAAARLPGARWLTACAATLLGYSGTVLLSAMARWQLLIYSWWYVLA